MTIRQFEGGKTAALNGRLKVLMVAMGSAGDVFPFVEVGRGLRSRGHAVTLVANEYFEATAQSAYLNFVSSGPREEYLRTIRDERLWTASGSYKLMFGSLLAAILPIYHLIEAQLDRDLIVVAPSVAFGARIAQEKLGVRLISMNVETNIFRSKYEWPGRNIPPRWLPLLRPLRIAMMAALDDLVFDPALAPRLNEVRQSLGLPPVRRILRDWIHSPDGVIGLFPDWFATRQRDWPDNLFLTGFPFFSGHPTVAPDLDQFLSDGPPPIVFTQGTAMTVAQKFLQTAVSACRQLSKRGILLTQFRDQVPEKLPPTIYSCDYVPLSGLLPRSLAIVHHGGIGTTAEALRAGIPQLVTPMIFDQPHNAARIEQLGVGGRLSPRRYDVSKLVSKLRQVIESPEIERRCHEVAGWFDGADPIGKACSVVEKVAHRP
jgi:rhamnosyltransferase subunit B